jgi:hypothetical protein
LIYPPNTRSSNTSPGFIGTADNGWPGIAIGDAAFLNNTTRAKVSRFSRARNDNREYTSAAGRYREKTSPLLSGMSFDRRVCPDLSNGRRDNRTDCHHEANFEN